MCGIQLPARVQATTVFTGRIQRITEVPEPTVLREPTGHHLQVQVTLIREVHLSEAAAQVTTAGPHLHQEVTRPAAPAAREVQDVHHPHPQEEDSKVRTI